MMSDLLDGDKPLDDREIEMMRDAVKTLVQAGQAPAAALLLELLEVLPRSQKENARLRAEVAAMRPIVEAVANKRDEDYEEECAFCLSGPSYLPLEHDAECPVTQARTYLAAHPVKES